MLAKEAEMKSSADSVSLTSSGALHREQLRQVVIESTDEAVEDESLTGKQRDLRVWLASLDLASLESVFRTQGIDIDTVRYLDKGDLEELGVVGMGPLKKLLVEIERLKMHGVKVIHFSFLVSFEF